MVEPMGPREEAKQPPLLRHARQIQFNIDIIRSYHYFVEYQDGWGALRNLDLIADELEAMAAQKRDG